jgi:hypothetical protein
MADSAATNHPAGPAPTIVTDLRTTFVAASIFQFLHVYSKIYFQISNFNF